MNINYPDLSTSQSAYLVNNQREHQLFCFFSAAVLFSSLLPLWEGLQTLESLTLSFSAVLLKSAPV